LRAPFFERQAMAVEQAPDRTQRYLEPVCLFEMRHDLGQRDVRRLVDQRQDFRRMRLDAVRVPVTAHGPELGMTLETPPLHPFDRRRGRDAEPLRCRTAGLAALDRGDEACAKVLGKRGCHTRWPPSPARMLNHFSAARRIPHDSVR
jgi:hypothetical protein